MTDLRMMTVEKRYWGVEEETEEDREGKERKREDLNSGESIPAFVCCVKARVNRLLRTFHEVALPNPTTR